MKCNKCIYVFNKHRCYECPYYPKDIVRPKNPIRRSPIDGLTIVAIPIDS